MQVCPTGIDIRNGLQYECISCGACIDVCDTVMRKMSYPEGLIRYTTQNELERGTRRRILRPRVLAYGAALAVIALALLAAVLVRVPLELDVLRDRNALYRETASGWIENVYTLKVLNMDTRAHRYAVSAEGPPGAELVLERAPVAAAAGAVVEVPARLRVPRAALAGGSQPVYFVLQAEDDTRLRVRVEARFLGPAS